jgi:predicted  nucleic acid-binding Zn-ribbon protein
MSKSHGRIPANSISLKSKNMFSLNPFKWFKGSRSNEVSSHPAATSVPPASNRGPIAQTAADIGHRQATPVGGHAPQSKQPNPPAQTSSIPPRTNPSSMTQPPPPLQPIPKPQSTITEPINLTKVELDDLKRKVDLIATNMTKVANENERLVRSQEQWAANFSDRQKVQDISAKLTIENDNVKLLQTKVADSVVEIGNYQKSLTAQAERITSLEARLEALTSSLEKANSELDQAAKEKAAAAAGFADLSAQKDALELEKQAAISRGDALATDLSGARGDCDAKAAELRAVIAGINSRLAQFSPQGILESKLAVEVAAFDAAAASGDQASLRVMAGLSQLRAGFIPGAGPDDKLAAVKSLGAALHVVWSAQSKDFKTIHQLFAEWQNFLNDLPGAGYQLVVPDLGQSVPQNVTALDGATKVNEVLLWIVKGRDGGIYSKGIVR